MSETKRERRGKMGTIWRITLDRFGDESRTKLEQGKAFSVIETGDLLVKEYKEQKYMPKLEVDCIGYGMALSDYLTEKKIPHTKIMGSLHRVGSADVFKKKEKEG